MGDTAIGKLRLRACRFVAGGGVRALATYALGMRWLVCCIALAGCVRVRATVVHPTEHARESSGASGSTIARTAPATDVVPDPPEQRQNLGSLELGAMVPFDAYGGVQVHLAPGVRIFDSHPGSILWGVAVGADWRGSRGGPGFALEGSVHAGSSGSDRTLIVQAVDVFTGVTIHPHRAPMSMAIGPSLGVLGMPGGASVITVGLGFRVTGTPKLRR